mgnify:CR=1 FL=1
MSFARGLIPVVGPPIEAFDTITNYERGEMSFGEAAARMAAIGGSAALHLIVAFKHVPLTNGNLFHLATVRKAQRVFYMGPVVTAGVAGAAVVAGIQHKTKAGMREAAAYRTNPFSYTTPFSSGFGTVV